VAFLLELRQIKIAGKEKHIIEELQRKKRRYRDRHNLEFQPKYFEKATINDIEFWQYNGEYDKEKKNRIKHFKKNGLTHEMEFVCDDFDYHDNEEVEEQEPPSEESREIEEDNGENYELPEEEEVPDDD